MHKFIGPTYRVESHLGWGIDTTDMTVFMKKERKEYILKFLNEYATKTIRKKDLDSLIGIISFCAQDFLRTSYPCFPPDILK